MRLAFTLLALVVAAVFFGQVQAEKLTSLNIRLIQHLEAPDRSSPPIIFPVKIGGENGDAISVENNWPVENRKIKITIFSRNNALKIIEPEKGQIPVNCTFIRNEMFSCSAIAIFNSESEKFFIVPDSENEIIGINTILISHYTEWPNQTLSITYFLFIIMLISIISISLNIKIPSALYSSLTILWMLSYDIVSTAIILLISILSYFFIINSGRFRVKNVNPIAVFLSVFVGERALGLVINSTAAWHGLSLIHALGLSYILIKMADLAQRQVSREIGRVSFSEYMHFLFFPATLSAGPIYSLTDFRKNTGFYQGFDDRMTGLIRIAIGWAKSSLAKTIAFAVNKLFGAYLIGHYDGQVAILLLMGNMLAVYLEFSGYSDMAIGLSRLLGWKVPENFNSPLLRSNMRAFWSSWHMSMTNWVTRQIFMPMALATRQSPRWIQLALPVFLTMLAIGFWHGFALVWILWACHHTVGILLADASGWFANKKTANRSFALARKIMGVAFVWYWFALSQAFTMVASPSAALTVYVNAMTFGMIGR
jgi:D-alanyl-lipoteichoic acid acyltransferase DltB (MBOAT superfamily)